MMCRSCHHKYDYKELQKRIVSETFKKHVNQIDIHGNIIKLWNSMTEAECGLKLNKGSITRVCQGKWKHTKGYMFKYL